MFSKIAIIGGAGKMGRLFARLLTREGKQVVISGRDQVKLAHAARELGVQSAGNVEAAKQSDAIIVSVSIDSFETAIKEIAPHLQPHQVVLDVTSLKEFPVDIMHRYIKGATVLGTHPVFGPGTGELRGQNVVLTPQGEAESELAAKLGEWLKERGAGVSIMTPREHDELMTVVLGLAHFISLVSADTLAAQSNLGQLNTVSGNTFRSLATLVKSVVSEDPQLYSFIQMTLPGLAEVERLFQERAKLWADMVAHKDREAFIERMREVRARLDKAL